MDQNGLARRFKISQSTVSRWLGGATPSMEILEALAAELGTSWQWLVVGEALKELGGVSQQLPIILKVDEQNFMVAVYQKTERGFPVYHVKHRNIRALSIAVTIARDEQAQGKL